MWIKMADSLVEVLIQVRKVRAELTSLVKQSTEAIFCKSESVATGLTLATNHV
jgi:hypothetical protein